jgi:hypothetical protein
MQKTAAIIFSLLLVLISGCDFGGSGALKKANETNAFASLKMISSAQNVIVMEDDKYAETIPDIDRRGYGSERTMRQVVAAYHKSANKTPYSGYYFADIEEDESGRTLDRRVRYGLTAYPSTPGITGDIMIILLIDRSKVRFNENHIEGRPDTSDEIQYWVASYKDIGRPVLRWPSEDELNTKFRRIKMKSPSEALQEAEELKKRYDEGRIEMKDIEKKGIDGR